MPYLHGSTDEERTVLLRRSIRRKCRFHIPDARLDHIISHVNIRRPYSIKMTTRPEKFLNITTSEQIATETTRTISEIIPIYGAFTPGHFVKLSPASARSVSGSLDKNNPAAAVKISLHQSVGEPAFSTHTLIIYEP